MTDREQEGDVVDESDEHPPHPLREIIRLLHGNARSLHDLHAKVDIIMTDQDTLNADVAAIEAALGAIATEIATLKTANPAMDFTGLDKLVADATALVPAAPAPVPAPAPAPTPAP